MFTKGEFDADLRRLMEVHGPELVNAMRNLAHDMEVSNNISMFKELMELGLVTKRDYSELLIKVLEAREWLTSNDVKYVTDNLDKVYPKEEEDA